MKEYKPINIIVPSGVGDISWVYSKISKAPREIHMQICGETPQRSLEYVKLLPNIKSAEYVKICTYDLLDMEQPKTYQEFLNWPEDKPCPLIANNWLDEGNRIEGWLPDGEVDHYYDISIPDKAKNKAQEALKDMIYPVGILMAHENAVYAWRGWQPEEWLILIKKLYQEFPFITFIFLGAYWDVGMMNQMQPYLKLYKIPYIDLVGRTHIAETIAILERLKMFIAFASGMNMLSTRAKKRNIMFYPSCLERLMYAWPPQEMIDNGFYQPFLWQRPVDILTDVIRIIRKSMAEQPEALASRNVSKGFIRQKLINFIETGK